jgi:hypothetical protein
MGEKLLIDDRTYNHRSNSESVFSACAIATAIPRYPGWGSVNSELVMESAVRNIERAMETSI